MSCGRCSWSGWVDVPSQNNAVRPCEHCCADAYARWKSGALTGRSDSGGFDAPPPPSEARRKHEQSAKLRKVADHKRAEF